MILEKRMETLDYYSENAKYFSEGTKDIDFIEIQERFLQYLKSGSRILDFGCGSGRDTRYFLSKGYQVDAVDGCAELCTIASEFTGQPVMQMLFHELSSTDTYDGIWACSSLLHVPYKELAGIFNKVASALKDKGIFYSSFKYGEYEGIRKGRHFTDMTEAKLIELLHGANLFEIKELWITKDVRPDREEEWLNVIMMK